MTSNINAWPDKWPKYYNGSTSPCDVRSGPCCCGATHSDAEFIFNGRQLLRDGKPVAEIKRDFHLGTEETPSELRVVQKHIGGGQ